MFFIALLVLSSICACFAFQHLGMPRNQLEISQKKIIGAFNTLVIGTSVLTGLSNNIANAEEKSKPKTKKIKVLETENGVKYIEVKKGEGVYPADGDYVVINYTGFLPDGEVFDTTEGKGKKPLSFRIGRKQIIPGIEEVLREMRAGGEVTCTIPSKLAYGSKGVCIEGQGCLVKPDTNLNYVIKLKSVGAGFN